MSRRPKTGRVGNISASHGLTQAAEFERLRSMPVPPDKREPTPAAAPVPAPQPKSGRGRSLVIRTEPRAPEPGSVNLSAAEAERVLRSLRTRQAETKNPDEIARLMRSKTVVKQSQRRTS